MKEIIGRSMGILTSVSVTVGSSVSVGVRVDDVGLGGPYGHPLLAYSN